MMKYLFALVVLIGCSSSDTTTRCRAKTCSDYTTQLEAQVAFDANKACLKDLNDDKDGIALHASSWPEAPERASVVALLYQEHALLLPLLDVLIKQKHNVETHVVS